MSVKPLQETERNVSIVCPVILFIGFFLMCTHRTIAGTYVIDLQLRMITIITIVICSCNYNNLYYNNHLCADIVPDYILQTKIFNSRLTSILFDNGSSTVVGALIVSY